METPTISVVVPSYNQGRYLRTALASLVAQQDSKLEIIVCDGGSKDDSVSIIKEFLPAIAHWYSEPDGGQSAAINRGVALASGAVVTWLNSDDVLAPGAIAQIRAAISRHGFRHRVFFGDHAKINAEGRTLGHFRATQLRRYVVRHYGWYVCQPGTFFDRALFLGVGGVDPELHVMMDIDLWWKFDRAGCHWDYLPVELALFRKHGESKGASLQTRWHKEQELLRARYTLRSSALQRWSARLLHWGLSAPRRWARR